MQLINQMTINRNEAGLTCPPGALLCRFISKGQSDTRSRVFKIRHYK